MRITSWDPDHPSELFATLNKKEIDMIARDHNKITVGQKLPVYKLLRGTSQRQRKQND